MEWLQEFDVICINRYCTRHPKMAAHVLREFWVKGADTAHKSENKE